MMISLYDLIEFARGQLFGEPSAQIFTTLCFTPREVTPNTLFVALGNDNADSQRAIEEAITNGASGILCARPPSVDTYGLSVVLVKDPIESLMLWTHGVLSRRKTKVILAAGSSGNSTTVTAVERVLSSQYRCYVAPTPEEDIDPRLSAARAVAHLLPEHDIALIPLDVSRRTMLARAVQALRPHAAIITALHHTKLDNFGSLDAIADEYRSIATSIPPHGLLILNYDNDYVRLLAEDAEAPTQTISVDNFGATLMAYSVVEGSNGTGFDLRYNNEKFIGRWTPLLGRSQLYSVLSALLVGKHFGISIEESLDLLRDITPVPHHMQPIIGYRGAFVIDDTHNNTPESTMAALDWVAAFKENHQRAVFILGDIGGLGTYSGTAHRMIGRHAANVVDFFIAQGTQAAVAARAALDEGMDAARVHTTYSTPDTLTLLRERWRLSENDIILIKGGRDSGIEEIVQALTSAEGVGLDTPGGMVYHPVRPTWIEIDTEALAQNVHILKQQVGPQVALMAVVKADAYGHGAIRTAQTALLNGAEYLGVGNLEEALILREAGINAPILIMNYVPPYGVRQAAQHHLTATVYDLDSARALERAARDIGQRLRVHVKIDSGMGRLGVLPEDAMSLFRAISRMSHLEVEGIYTHFASADEDDTYTAHQVEVFKEVIRPLKASGFQFKYIHAANSAGLIANAANHFNMVRVGIALYGLRASDRRPLPEGIRPVMTWKTVVAQVKTLPPGHSVGYGGTYRTRGKETVAVICVGYADGYRRAPRRHAEVLIHGTRAPVIGRISMEKTVVNVTHIPNVAMGDEVVLLGRQGRDTISAEEIAKWLDTSNYELVCNVLPRVPRR